MRRLFQVRVEAQVFSRQKLGGEQNLARMLPKMSEHVEDCLQPGHMIVLNLHAFGEPFIRDGFDLRRGAPSRPAR